MNETPLTEIGYGATDALWPSLHAPQWLWLLPVVLIVFGLLMLVARRGREQALSTFAAPRLLGSLLASLSRTRRAFKSALVLIGAALVVLAVSRPQYGYRWTQSHARGIDIMFVLDTSRSMLATDIRPDRLQRAKLAILDFVDQLQGDRIGLVAFAGDAFVQCPLTLDYRVFAQSLEAVNTDTIAVGGTDFAKAITIAEDAFAKDKNHKILIMLTDGEDLEGQGLKRAKEASAHGVTIFTVGVGTPEGSPIPVTDRFGRQSYLTDENGAQVITRLGADTLEDIAEVTGGFYVPLGSTGQGLETVYHDGLQSFEKQDLSSQMKREGIDRFQWPLGLAILLLAWEPLISNRRAAARRALNLFRRKRRVKTATGADINATPTAQARSADKFSAANATASQSISQPAKAKPAATAPGNSALSALAALLGAATVATAFTPATTQAASARDAEALFSKGDFAAAQQAFSEALHTDPANTRTRYNLANTLLAQKQYEEAAKTYAQVLTDADIALQADAFYNLGLAHYGRGTQAFEGSDPAQTQAQSAEARNAAAQAVQAGQQLLSEAARLRELDGRAAAPDTTDTTTTQGVQIPEIPQEAVQQALQMAEQAKQASETAIEDGSAFLEKAQAASGFWRRAEADFNSAAALSLGNSADARHNAEQTQKGIDALRARISQTERAEKAHANDVATLDALIEELKKLLKQPPQDDQQQDQQQQNDQQNQDQNQNDQQQNQDQQNQQNQSDSQSGDSQQDDQQNQDQQNGQNSGGDSQNKDNAQDKSDPQQDQGGQSGDQGDKEESQPSGEDDSPQSGDKPEQDKSKPQNEGDEQGKDNAQQTPQSEQQGGEQPDTQNNQQQGEQNNQPQQDESREQQGNEPQGGQPERGEDERTPQPSAGSEREQGASAEERGAQAQAGEEAVDLTEEQADQMAAAGEGALQDQPATGQQEGAVQRAGAMSQQEAAGLLESIRNSGRLLPLSGRGGQSQPQTRPRRNW